MLLESIKVNQYAQPPLSFFAERQNLHSHKPVRKKAFNKMFLLRLYLRIKRVASSTRDNKLNPSASTLIAAKPLKGVIMSTKVEMDPGALKDGKKVFGKGAGASMVGGAEDGEVAKDKAEVRGKGKGLFDPLQLFFPVLYGSCVVAVASREVCVFEGGF